LRYVPTSVVALDEHPAWIPGARGHASMPDVRHEEGDVARLGDDGNAAPSLPVEVVVGNSVDRRRLSGCVTSGNDSSRASLDRQSLRYRWLAMTKTGYGMRISQGKLGSRGTCGPLSMCQKRPRWSLLPVGCHQAVLAMM